VLARSIVSFLERRGFSAAFAVDAQSALVMFKRENPRLVILDVRLGRDNGLDLLVTLRATNPEAQVVVMTGHGDVGIAVEAMKRGARDFLMKPAPLAMIATMAADLILQDVTRLSDPTGLERVIGRSSAAIDVRATLKRLASAAEGNAAPGVLITGPRGSGKMLAARALYELAAHRRGRAVTIDCSLGSDPLAGALSDGAGTLILRHVEELSDEAQALLAQWIEADPSLWVIATTSRNLGSLERRGSFRSDLLYRIQVGWVDIPPLTDHSSDILPLSEEFSRRVAQRYGRARPRFSAEARVRLLQHDWPGNVAELENCIERAVIQTAEGLIDAEDIKIIDKADAAESIVPNLLKMEETALVKALRSTGGNVSRAADMLGISRDTLRYRMEKFGISRR
jgi:DNA-binding NtrC family response regulator